MSVKKQAALPLNGIKLLLSDSLTMGKKQVSFKNWRTWGALAFITAFCGDIVTTQWMMSSNLTEEGNPVALIGMSILGQTGYVVLASLMFASLVFFTLSRPKHYAGWIVQLSIYFILLVKFEVVLNNIGLWTGLWSGIGG